MSSGDSASQWQRLANNEFMPTQPRQLVRKLAVAALVLGLIAAVIVLATGLIWVLMIPFALFVGAASIRAYYLLDATGRGKL